MLLEFNTWSQLDLALIAALTADQIIEIEREDLTVTNSLAGRFADVFGVSVAVILSDVGKT